MYRKNGSKRPGAHLDFTSALYLGINHDTGSLLPWQSLTTGVPAALKEPPATVQVAKAIARMQGMDDGMLFPSTLHLFWDLFENLSQQPIVIFIDHQTYPIAKWGVDRAAIKGVPVFIFPHNNVKGLQKKIRYASLNRRRPVVVADSWCPQFGKATPIVEYLEILRPYHGLLVLDDTQPLGVLGKHPHIEMPYGYGGGGVLPWLGIQSRNIVLGSSMAKGFGVPVASLCGSFAWVNTFRKNSKTRIHCSPPSAAEISAAWNAIRINHKKGDYLRLQLLERIKFFRKGLQRLGFDLRGGHFPIQTITNLSQEETLALFHRLKKENVHPILTRSHRNDRANLTFLLTAVQPRKNLKKVLKLVARMRITDKRKPGFLWV